mmetsp:Transcript_47193/g.109499  ORF Transcript_47193/g.109499 Transcript_47193/m.109499 type:complete len:240 (-) Transcript_47193:269-988(-)
MSNPPSTSTPRRKQPPPHRQYYLSSRYSSVTRSTMPATAAFRLARFSTSSRRAAFPRRAPTPMTWTAKPSASPTRHSTRRVVMGSAMTRRSQIGATSRATARRRPRRRGLTVGRRCLRTKPRLPPSSRAPTPSPSRLTLQAVRWVFSSHGSSSTVTALPTLSAARATSRRWTTQSFSLATAPTAAKITGAFGTAGVSSLGKTATSASRVARARAAWIRYRRPRSSMAAWMPSRPETESL